MTCGIYAIHCKSTDKYYIGASTNVKRRWAKHRYDFRHGHQYLKDLQSDYETYGENDFTYSVLEECSKSQLNEREEYYTELYSNHYNIRIGQKIAESSKRIMSLQRKGRKPSKETVAKMVASRIGTHRTDETKRKMSLSARQSATCFKRTHTEDVIISIFLDYLQGISQCDLMRKYNERREFIYKIVNFKRWSYLTLPLVS